MVISCEWANITVILEIIKTFDYFVEYCLSACCDFYYAPSKRRWRFAELFFNPVSPVLCVANCWSVDGHLVAGTRVEENFILVPRRTFVPHLSMRNAVLVILIFIQTDIKKSGPDLYTFACFF